MQPTWGIIGVGQLGASLVEGLFRSGSAPRISLSPRSEKRVRDLATRYPLTVAASEQQVVDRSDHLVLALPPDSISDVAGGLRFREGQMVVSVSGATSLGAVRAAVAPATAVCAMPVLSAEMGESPTCMFPGNEVAGALFGLLGPVHVLGDEAAYEVAGVTATYYVWLYSLMERVARWHHEGGVDLATSRALVAGMTRAAAARCLGHGGDMEELAAEIARPGTLTRVGADCLAERDALDAWTEACGVVLAAKRARAR